MVQRPQKLREKTQGRLYWESTLIGEFMLHRDFIGRSMVYKP